ncbi:prepilin peptidase [Desulfovibrio aminophilus]|uniref:A24 family peptidase n=1 Tax=Desulfovibrio aminophilus TaxID=81425 RepID=UPI00339A3D64
MDMLIGAIVCAMLSVAVVTDLWDQKIPNLLTLPAMLAGLAYHGLARGLDGLAFSAAGLALGLAVMLVPFLLRLMGGGDVKLMAAVGAWLGAADVFSAFLFTCLAGGLYALFMLLRLGLLPRVLRNIRDAFLVLVATRKLEYAPVPAPVGRPLPRLCYGLAIAAGTVFSLAFTAWERGTLGL